MAVLKKMTQLTMIGLLAVGPIAFSSNHREAPITALDHKADITDLYAFVSYGSEETNAPRKVTLIMSVDPFLEASNGPNWSPFDPEILYEIKVDNDHDAVEDVTFQFRFSTEQRLPGLFQVFAGAGSGVVAPGNSPAPVPPGTLIVPPRITSFDSPGLQKGSFDSHRMFAGFGRGHAFLAYEGLRTNGPFESPLRYKRKPPTQSQRQFH